MSPDRRNLVVTSQNTPIELAAGGYTDNVSFFVNVVFSNAGTYWVQTLADEVVMDELPLIVTDTANAQQAEVISETVN